MYKKLNVFTNKISNIDHNLWVYKHSKVFHDFRDKKFKFIISGNKELSPIVHEKSADFRRTKDYLISHDCNLIISCNNAIIFSISKEAANSS